MGEEPAHRDAFLARLRELGPVRSDGRVEINEVLIHQEQEAHGREGLGDGVDMDKCPGSTRAPSPGPRCLPTSQRRATHRGKCRSPPRLHRAR